MVLRIEIYDSYKFAYALKRPEAENSDPGALREERSTEPQWDCSSNSLSWRILKYSVYF